MFEYGPEVEAWGRGGEALDVSPLERLRFAVAATQHGGGLATMTAKVRRYDLDAFQALVDGLSADQLLAVEQTARRLHGDGVVALLLGRAPYPSNLAATRNAPAALFLRGPLQLLERPALGLCGSRHATEEGLRAARACGEAVASHRFTVVSGYARGVDVVAHTAALDAGGATVMVLAEGIDHFRIRRGDFARAWDPTRAVVVSQFAPSQPWSAGAAMARNAVISGLSRALVVVEAGDTGGTLAAGLHALAQGQPVIALQLSGLPSGNEQLQSKGASVVRSRAELEALLDDLPSGTTQLSLM